MTDYNPNQPGWSRRWTVASWVLCVVLAGCCAVQVLR